MKQKLKEFYKAAGIREDLNLVYFLNLMIQNTEKIDLIKRDVNFLKSALTQIDKKLNMILANID